MSTATDVIESADRFDPMVKSALTAGIQDLSHANTAWGWTHSYAGEAEITLPDGSRWHCVGVRAGGKHAEYPPTHGCIRFTRID